MKKDKIAQSSSTITNKNSLETQHLQPTRKAFWERNKALEMLPSSAWTLLITGGVLVWYCWVTHTLSLVFEGHEPRGSGDRTDLLTKRIQAEWLITGGKGLLLQVQSADEKNHPKQFYIPFLKVHAGTIQMPHS